MTTNYPGAKDTFSVKQDNNGEKVAAADVNNLQDAVSALEQTVGYGATQPTATPTASVIPKWDSNKGLSAAAFIPQGLTGATAASRYVGATTSGAPSSGTFAVGDWVIDQTATIWICTAAGSPGTWKTSGVGADTWHQPTLLNGWVNYDGTGGQYNRFAAYRKNASGQVELKGLVKSGTVGDSTPIFTLPVGYRPAYYRTFTVNSNSAFGVVSIHTDGSVCALIGSNTFFYLDGGLFLAEQ